MAFLVGILTQDGHKLIHIPADASKSIKLAHEVDILFERYRQNRSNLSRSHEFTELTYSNPQFVVYYQ